MMQHAVIGIQNDYHDGIHKYRFHPHHPEKIRADTAAGNHHKNGPRYGIISNNHANIARVHFWGILIPNNSNAHSHKYDIIHMNTHKKSWLFNQVVIPEYAASILGNMFV